MSLSSLGGSGPVTCLHVIEEGRQPLGRAAAVTVYSIHVTAGTGVAATLWIRANDALAEQ